MDEQTMQAISTESERVAREHAEHQAAISAERDAEAAVLERVIEIVRPALRAICSRFTSSEADTSGRNGCNPVREREWYPTPGICVVDEEHRVRDESGNRGDITGHDVWLLADGRLARGELQGTWSCWQGEWDRLERDVRIVTPREVCQHNLDEIIKSILAALRADARAESTAAARKRTTTLAGILALL